MRLFGNHLAALAAAALLLSAAPLCGGADTAQAASAGDRTSAVVYLGTRSEPKMGFDPLKGFANVDGVSIFHSNLITLNSDLTFSKDFAADYSVSEDGLTYTFDLRDDVKCTDGEPLTSRDVKFTFENAGKSGFVGNLEGIERIETPSPTRVVFHMKEANSLFLYTIARLPLVPEHAYKEGYGLNPVGSGPFKMVEWRKGQQMIVEANPDYHKGKPRLDKLTFLFVAGEAALEAAKAGKIDVYDEPYNYATVPIPGSKMQAFKSVGKFVISLPTVPPGQVPPVKGKSEVGNAVTADPAIRRALNVGINRAEIVSGLMHGYGAPAYGLIDKESPYYNTETDYTDNNAQEAKAILAAGGWKDADGDGIVDKDGVRAAFTLLASAKDKMLQNVAMLVAHQAKQIGIHIDLEVKSPEEIDTRMHKDAWVLNFGSLDPMNIYYLYYSPMAGQGYYNIGFYKNPTVDGYIEQAMRAPSQEAANEFWKKGQWDGATGYSVRGDAPYLWLVNKNYMYQVREGFSIGEQPALQPGTMGWCIARNIERWGWQ